MANMSSPLRLRTALQQSAARTMRLTRSRAAHSTAEAPGPLQLSETEETVPTLQLCDKAGCMCDSDEQRESGEHSDCAPNSRKREREYESLVTEQEMKQLCAFDQNEVFGPCLGITRLERWERAQRLYLDPPLCVFDTLDSLDEDDPAHHCLYATKCL